MQICMCDVEEKPHKEISPQQATSPMDQLKIGHGVSSKTFVCGDLSL